VDAAVTLGDPLKMSFTQPRETRAKR